MKDLIKEIWNWIVSIPQDKLLHDYFGLLIAMFVFAIIYRFVPIWCCFVVADVVSICALALKKFYDSKHREGNSVEWADFLCGLFGVAKFNVAMLIMFV